MPSYDFAGQSTATTAHQNSNDRSKASVNAKSVDFDLRVAFLLASSNESIASFCPKTLQGLSDKHPPSPEDILIPAPPDNDLTSPVIAAKEHVVKALKSSRVVPELVRMSQTRPP